MRFNLSYLVVLVILSLPGCAQKEKKPDKGQVLLGKSGIPGKPIGWVSDFEAVFTSSQIIFLDSILSKHEAETTNEIAVVTFPLDSTLVINSEDFKELSLALFRNWGIGKKGTNNGIGILFSRKLRKIRIEVGYGLEAKLTNAEAKEIIDSMMTPEFKNGDYYKGILNGLAAIIKEIR